MKLDKCAPLSGLASIIIIRKRKIFYSLIGLVLMQFSTLQAVAQFTKLQDLGSTQNGMNPYSTPVSDGIFLYGMTSAGGTNNLGTIYKVKLDGSGFTKLLDFDGKNGQTPYGSLFLDTKNQILYGMTNGGGANGYGLIFKINTDGSGFVDLFDLDYTNSGAYPYGSLIYDPNVNYLYGMAKYGGKYNGGTAFKIRPDGTGFTVLVDFAYSTGSSPVGSLTFDNADKTILYGMTNGGGSGGYGTIFSLKNDGTYSILYDLKTYNVSSPNGSLITDASGTYLYGTTAYGSSNSNNAGVIFKAKTDGSDFSVVFNFDYNVTGGYPKGDLVFDETGAYLCGMNTQSSALPQFGTIFKVKTDGSSFTKLLNVDVMPNGLSGEGTLIRIGPTLYGVRSGGSTSSSGQGYLGTVFKINTDGSGYTKFYNFKATGNSPNGSLASDASYLYGMTQYGGLYNYGVIFKVKPDGSGYTELLNFDGSNTGKHPNGALIYDGAFLYGMTTEGGKNDAGVIFKIKTDGTSFSKLYEFDGASNGGYPYGSLVFDKLKTALYGMTSSGGKSTSGYGVIFSINPDGSNFSVLLSFDGSTQGGYPNGSLVFDKTYTYLYGMANSGGAGGNGLIFSLNITDKKFSDLLDFDYNNNGAYPSGDLYYDGTYLYGMTPNGGKYSDGTIIKILTDGSGYTKLFDFDYNITGDSPNGSLISDDGVTLYGITYEGGAIGWGTIFQIKNDGTNFSKLMDLNDASFPQGSLYSDGTFLYGMSQNGGSNDLGTIFKLTKTSFPSVASVYPSSGVVGMLVTITGTNFDPIATNNIVKFNNVAALVFSSTSTTIKAIVPAGATTGPVTVTTNLTAKSTYDFAVTTSSYMFDGSLQSCNTQFTEPGGESNVVETFYPNNPATDKIQVSFSSFKPGSDILNVYNGPSTSSPLIVSLGDGAPPASIVSTSPGGELTFEFQWGDGSSTTWVANVTCQTSATAITITTQPSDFIACLGDVATFTTAATGTTNITYQWQYSPDGKVAFTDLANGANYSNVTTATLSVNTSGNFGVGRYRCKIGGDLVTTVYTNDEGLFINPLPAAPTTQGSSACPPNAITLSASGGTNGQYRWYTSATGGNAIQGEVNSTYTTPVLTVTTTYYVSINNGTCESARISVAATINDCNPPVIAPANLSTLIGGTITINLNLLITSSNLDKSSIQIVGMPASGASASIDADGILTINYAGKAFAGIEKITIKACDFNGQCSTQDLTIDVVGDIVVYNGISPNGANPKLILQYIDVLPDTKQNTVYIFDRWENQVWHGSNYDNDGVVFTGQSSGGSELPSGVYFYKIDFASGKKSKTGFISLRRQ
jgi:uncharacterized repeat protein (TIGR03803 family)